MLINFFPIRSDATLRLSRSGDILTVNGEAYDFSEVPDGATLPREAVTCDWLAGDIERVAGQLRLSLILPHGANAPAQTRYPESLNAPEGNIVVPAANLP